MHLNGSFLIVCPGSGSKCGGGLEGDGGVPLQIDMHLNGSFLIVCPGSGSMCVCVYDMQGCPGVGGGVSPCK